MFKLKKMSLKVKLIALFLLVGLVPMGVVGLLSYDRAQRGIREEVISGMLAYTHLVEMELEEEFAGWEGDAAILSNMRNIYRSLNTLHEVGGDVTDPAWQERVDVLDEIGLLVAEQMDFAEVFVTDPEGVVVYATHDDLWHDDLSGRDYVQGSLGGNLTWSELYYSDVIQENCMIVSAPVRSDGQSGAVVGTLNLLIDQQTIDDNLHGALHELGETADAYLIDADGLLLSNTMLGEFRQGAALNRSINTEAVELLSGPIRAGNWDFEVVGEWPDYLDNPVLGVLEVVRLGEQPAGLVVELFTSEADAGVLALRNMIIPIIGVSAVVVAVLAFFVASSIVRPVQKVSDLTRELAAGDFTVRADIKSQDEIGQMAANLNKTIDVLSETLGRVQETSDNVSHASAEISSGNQDLSQRTEEQASSLEEVSSTIEEMSSSLETSSANAAEADNLSGGTLDSVRQGETVVKDMQGAMTEITRGSQEISEIISTVNDIAFQTNLLALNAAVEAARAGEQGRGFAVVAAEVRNLAGRSAESAKEIEKLIKDSIVRVEKGNTLMNDTEKVLQEIVANTQKTSDVVGEIASSLREQSTASGEIRNAIEELNQVTQQNASLVEEIASSSENMNSEAQELAEKVSFFKISENGVKKSNKQPSKEKLDKQNYNNEYAQTEERARVKKDLQAVAAAPLGNGPQFREEDFEKF